MIDQDVSRVVGQTVVAWKFPDGKPRHFILDNVGFDDWSAAQSWLLRDKRTRIVQTALDCVAIMPPDEANKLRREALQMAGDLAGLTPAEYQDILNRSDGLARFLWVMFERRYPGQVSLRDVETMLREEAIDETKILEVMDAITFAMGLDPAKKKTETNPPTNPPDQATSPTP